MGETQQAHAPSLLFLMCALISYFLICYLISQHAGQNAMLLPPRQEGCLRTECYTQVVLDAIAADPLGFAAPGGESQGAVEARMMRIITDRVLPALTPGGPPAVIVTHGLAIKWYAPALALGACVQHATACLPPKLQNCTLLLCSFLRGVLGSNPRMTWKIALGNASLTEVAWADAGPAPGWHVLRVNDDKAVVGMMVVAPEKVPHRHQQ
jgi:hypothetical protein